MSRTRAASTGPLCKRALDGPRPVILHDGEGNAGKLCPPKRSSDGVRTPLRQVAPLRVGHQGTEADLGRLIVRGRRAADEGVKARNADGKRPGLPQEMTSIRHGGEAVPGQQRVLMAPSGVVRLGQADRTALQMPRSRPSASDGAD